MDNEIKRRILVVYGGPSREYEVSIQTAQSVLKYVDTHRFSVTPLHISKQGFVKCPSSTKKCRLEEISHTFLKDYDLAFLCTHGDYGEDGVIQGIFEKAELRYTGSRVKASRLCMDKYKSTGIVAKLSGIETIPTELVETKTKARCLEDGKFPVVVKPNNSGSSIGVYKATDGKSFNKAVAHLRKLQIRNYLIQPWIENAVEVSCGCLQRNDGQCVRLPPVEIVPKGSEFYDYRAKYGKNGSIHHVPPKSLDPKITGKISDLACSIHKALNCSSYSRSDFLVKGSTIYYLETNTLPGMTATSLIPEEAKSIGINFRDLITFIIESAATQPAIDTD